MTAKGKITAARVQVGDRILVKHYTRDEAAAHSTLDYLGKDRALGISATKTGAGVTVARVLHVEAVLVTGGRRDRRVYNIHTTEGILGNNAPAQTMMLASEDAAGIKRAHVEAIEEQGARWKQGMDDIWDEALAEDAEREAAELIENKTPAECPWCGGPLASDGVCADDECGADEQEPIVTPGTDEATPEDLPDPDGSNTLPIPAGPWFESEGGEDLTLNSHDGKVVDMNNDASTETPAQTRETTGSAVVRRMERVHARIRQNHPEVPEVVIVTGAGTTPVGGKWGHFRPEGWMAKGEETTTHIHEMFMAGETLAKGARQVLQTMLHESAHALAAKRGAQDTSRQGRWHNKVFLTTAGEMGLEYRKDKANPQIGYSEVTLKDETVEEYKDLLDALETEIHLMVRLPGWLRGAGDGDDNGESEGGEGLGKAPKGPATTNTNNVKCVCRCEEPNIIRMSRKVLDQAVVTCSDCDSLFSAA